MKLYLHTTWVTNLDSVIKILKGVEPHGPLLLKAVRGGE